MDRYTHTALESQQSAIESLPDYDSITEADAARKTGTDDAKTADSVCAGFCATSMQNDRISPDGIGQPPMKKAAGAESLNLSDVNEKAPHRHR